MLASGNARSRQLGRNQSKPAWATLWDCESSPVLASGARSPETRQPSWTALCPCLTQRASVSRWPVAHMPQDSGEWALPPSPCSASPPASHPAHTPGRAPRASPCLCCLGTCHLTVSSELRVCWGPQGTPVDWPQSTLFQMARL